MPEDPARPDGRRIDLAVAIVAAEAPAPGSTPLFPLEGGPGVSAREMAGLFEGPLAPFRRDRPAVLVDRRGTGGSAPLHCPELENHHSLQRMYPLDEVRRCAERLSREADLTHYSTPEAARDIDAVRRALGVERIDLWGMSYGTQLAREYLRQYPDRARSAVLIGAPAPGFRTPLQHAAAAQRALELVLSECRADPDCAAAYPDLRGEWTRLLARLEEEPARATWPGTGEAVEIRRDEFGEAFRGLLSTTEGQRRVPLVIHRAAAGDFAPFLAELAPPGGDAGWLAEGLYLSVTCAEETGRIDPAEVAAATAGTFLGDYRVREQREACAHWPMRDLPEEFFEPVRSDAPVLLLFGANDHVTPPWPHEVLIRDFPGARLVTMQHATHVYVTWEEAGDCFEDLALHFFAAGTAAGLDTSCTEASPPPFTLPVVEPAAPSGSPGR